MRAYNVPPWASGSGWRRDDESVPASQMRVSDAERRVIADKLSSHFADGRLDQSEFDERMGKAMSAKTRGDLAGLLADLPPLESDRPPAPTRRIRRSRPVLLLVGFAALFVATTSWAWNSFAWRNGFFHPHFGFLILALVAFMVLRRSRWHRHVHRMAHEEGEYR